jgi:cation:H+ antiporter
MNTLQSILLLIFGIALVLYFAEKLVKGTVGISLGFGISTFIISVIFIGFDPENLAVGAVGSYEGASGIALGSIIGAAMVAIALAFGLTALIAPMKFEKAPKQILIIPVLAVLLLGLLGLDGQLSRIDGAVLLLGFVLSIIYLIRLSKKGLDIQPTGEVAETLEDAGKLNKWKSLGIFILSLAGVVLGSELLVRSSQSIIAKMGLSDTVFGMTILAFLISIEELARELPAAIKGRPEISYGNVIGSILAFFLFNAGIIALVKPITVDVETLKYYLPICLVTTLIVSIFMSTKKVSRLAGAVLVLLYVAFAAVGFII